MRWHHRSRTPEEAAESLANAKRALEATRAQRDDVQRVAEQMRTYRLENHLAEKLRLAMGGKP